MTAAHRVVIAGALALVFSIANAATGDPLAGIKRMSLSVEDSSLDPPRCGVQRTSLEGMIRLLVQESRLQLDDAAPDSIRVTATLQQASPSLCIAQISVAPEIVVIGSNLAHSPFKAKLPINGTTAILWAHPDHIGKFVGNAVTAQVEQLIRDWLKANQ